jgi:uncharacterized protein (TIGR00297 family)
MTRRSTAPRESVFPAAVLRHGARHARAMAGAVPTRRLLLGVFLSAAISLLAYRRGALSRSGIAGAMLTGTTSFGLGGWSWGLSLIFFFASSSFFSRFRARAKAGVAADKFSKGDQRDIGQVLANGGVAALCALGSACMPASALREMCQAGYTGALATATADTWATELGVLSARPPRLITTGKRVAAGTSGGITPSGMAAAGLGALGLGGAFWLFEGCSRARAGLPLVGLLSGLGGSVVDSLLGATLQAMYVCPACGQETERRVHSCGGETLPLRGISWLNNDGVNFLSTLSGALLALSLWRAMRRGRRA